MNLSVHFIGKATNVSDSQNKAQLFLELSSGVFVGFVACAELLACAIRQGGTSFSPAASAALECATCADHTLKLN